MKYKEDTLYNNHNNNNNKKKKKNRCSVLSALFVTLKNSPETTTRGNTTTNR